jgi:hypothetical protein
MGATVVCLVPARVDTGWVVGLLPVRGVWRWALARLRRVLPNPLPTPLDRPPPEKQKAPQLRGFLDEPTRGLEPLTP